MSEIINYDDQLQAIKSASTDSGDYALRVEQVRADRRAAVSQSVAGCLLDEVARTGFNSRTPTACPVEGCDVTMSKDGEAANRKGCLSPDTATQDTHDLYDKKYAQSI